MDVSALCLPIANIYGSSVTSFVVAPPAALVEEWEETIEKLLPVAEEASMMLGREPDNKAARW